MIIELGIFETMAVVALVFYLGKYLKIKIPILTKYCIPPAIVGGVVFSIMVLILKLTDLATINLDVTLQPLFMTAFFTSIGFSASFSVLKRGGKQVAVFLLLAVGLILLQNITGVSIALMFNLNPLLGLCTGSIPMIGGHGTAGSFGPLIEALGISNATTVSIAAATFGLIMGSIVGGVVGKRLLTQYRVQTIHEDKVVEDEEILVLSTHQLMSSACLLFVAMGFGAVVSELIQYSGLTFPSYIGAMLVAAAIRNIADVKGIRLTQNEISTLGELSLSFFLTMALMSLNLWQLFDLAIPLVVMLIAQVLVVSLFAYFVTFKVMGRNYEGVIFATATCGFGMGATPNAIANMDELTNRYGFVYTPYFVVPIVGGLFIDFVNSGIITLFVNFLT